LAYLRGRPDVDATRIGGLGLSVGGEAFLEAAAQVKGFRAVVSDGAGARSVREDTVQMSLGKVPELAFSTMLTAGTVLFSNRLPPPNLKGLTHKIAPTAVFFIYATRGAGGEENNPEYYESAREPKQIWKVATSHTHGLSTYPEEYERRVVGFFDRRL
jgi:dienelactone hydrolase